MQFFRSARWLLLALIVTLVPLSSHAGVFISVGFAPPMLPVYEQPPCPEPGLMWMPGYWAYGEDGYFWVPGAWVPAPYEGALWTPAYWGWSGGLFVFHDGYWGRHVGYYGGVNYGFGYGGIGFAGGEWRDHHFLYNTAVVRVDRRYVHETFEDRGRVERGYVARDSHVAFSGGPGGIRHDPGREERMAEHEQHMARNSFQMQHESAARADRNSFARNNGGRPSRMAVDRPLGMENRHAPMDERNRSAHDDRIVPSRQQDVQPSYRDNRRGGNPQYQSRPDRMNGRESQDRPMPQSRPAPQSYPAPQSRPAPQTRPAPESRPAPQPHPAQQSRPAPKDEHQHR